MSLWDESLLSVSVMNWWYDATNDIMRSYFIKMVFRNFLRKKKEEFSLNSFRKKNIKKNFFSSSYQTCDNASALRDWMIRKLSELFLLPFWFRNLTTSYLTCYWIVLVFFCFHSTRKISRGTSWTSDGSLEVSVALEVFQNKTNESWGKTFFELMDEIEVIFREGSCCLCGDNDVNQYHKTDNFLNYDGNFISLADAIFECLQVSSSLITAIK